MQSAMLLFSIVHTAFAIFGCTCNALLFYLAAFQSPTAMRTYALLICNFAITDFLCCFSDFFVQQRLIPAGRALAYMSTGPCQLFGPRVCYIGYSMYLHCLAHSLWSLLMSFIYRYYVLQKAAPGKRSLVFIIFLVYSPSLFQFVSFLWAYDPPAIVSAMLRVRFPDYDLSGITVTGTMDIICFSALFTILHMTLPVTPVYATILVMRRRIIRFLFERESTMSRKTKAVHSQLLKALTYQAIIPGFMWFAVMSYALGQLGIFSHPLLEYFTFTAATFIPMLSPMSYLCFVFHYRRVLLQKVYKLAGKRFNREAKFTQSISTVADSRGPLSQHV